MQDFTVEDIFTCCCVQLSFDEETTQVSLQPSDNRTNIWSTPAKINQNLRKASDVEIVCEEEQ